MSDAFFNITWDITPEMMLQQLTEQYISAIEQAIENLLKSYAPTIETWMRDNAPWTDRTGDARQGLVTQVHRAVGNYVLVELAHSVDYGTYLEGWNPKTNSPMENAGQWSIIEPALDHFGPLIWNDLISMLRSNNISVERVD